MHPPATDQELRDAYRRARLWQGKTAVTFAHAIAAPVVRWGLEHIVQAQRNKHRQPVPEQTRLAI
jgi:hypothetical protein